MQNANNALTGSAGRRRNAVHPAIARQALFAFCVLHFAFAAGCTKTPPATTPTGPPAAITRSVAPLTQLRDAIATATSASGVQRGTWGIVVHSLDRNERLYELNPRALLVPASTAKLLSVASAVEAVGWDYRYTTRLGIAGSITNGVLTGDLVIEGNGDPAIGGRGGEDMAVFIDAVKAAGITRIDGRIVGNDDLLDEPRPAFAWTWDDLGYPSGALFGALNYGENRTTVTIAPGSVAGERPTLTLDAVAQDRPLVNRTMTVTRGSVQSLWPEQRPGEAALTIAGTIPVGAPPARIGISAGNPTFWFASVLRNRLIAAGIPVSGAAFDLDDLNHPIETTTIFTLRSRTLAEIAQPMLKESINLYAEAVMRLNAPDTPSPKTHDAALDAFKARMNGWGISSDAFQVVDGSGLSRRDTVSPEAFLAVLQRMYDPSGVSPWMRALPVAGVDGSLDARMKGTAAENNLRAKTGTMSNIRSLAGYVTTADGEHLAMVIILNDFEGTGAAALQAIDAIGARLAAFTRSGGG